MISCNKAMSVDSFNDSFYLTIGGSNSVDDDGDNNYGSVDNDVAEDYIVGGDNNGNDGDNRKGEGRK